MNDALMESSLMEDRVFKLAEAKSEQNILKALSLYHPEASLVSIGLDLEARGSAEIEQQLKIFFSLFPDYRVELKQVACNKQSLLATGLVYLSPAISEGPTRPIQQLCAFLFTFKDEQIYREEFYLDFGRVCQKANITPTQFREATEHLLVTSSH